MSPPKKENLSCKIRAQLFSNQSMLAAIFAQIFEFQKVIRDFSLILDDFARFHGICPDFRQIKTFGGVVHSLHACILRQ